MYGGAHVGLYWVIQIGRIVYGCGGEALAITHNVLLVSWFKAGELRRALTATQVAARVVRCAAL